MQCKCAKSRTPEAVPALLRVDPALLLLHLRISSVHSRWPSSTVSTTTHSPSRSFLPLAHLFPPFILLITPHTGIRSLFLTPSDPNCPRWTENLVNLSPTARSTSNQYSNRRELSRKRRSAGVPPHCTTSQCVEKAGQTILASSLIALGKVRRGRTALEASRPSGKP